MALLDILKQRKRSSTTGPAQAEDIATKQQQVATGKVGRGTGPAMSNVQAQLAAQAGQAERAQLGVQADIARQGLQAAEEQQVRDVSIARRAQEQRVDQATQNMLTSETISDNIRAADEARATSAMKAREELHNKELSNRYADALSQLASSRRITEQELFFYAKQAREELGLENYKSYLDQVGHISALSDRKYMDEIKRIGVKRRLEDRDMFKREAQQIMFGQNFEFLSQKFDMQQLINADEREYKKAVAQIDINMAIQMAQQAAKESAYKNMISGITEVGKGVVYSQLEEKEGKS